MIVLDIYLIFSTILLGYVASIWSGRAGLNLLIKLVFVLVAVFGCVLVAKNVLI